jgi:hypothetical protein
LQKLSGNCPQTVAILHSIAIRAIGTQQATLGHAQPIEKQQRGTNYQGGYCLSEFDFHQLISALTGGVMVAIRYNYH